MAHIVITQFDYDRLQRLLAKKRPRDDFDRSLLVELEKGDIVAPHKVPENVITMNSEVRLSDGSGKPLTYWVVFPEDADLAANKLSVLSPVGCALLGYKVGDTVEVAAPSGSQKLRVEEIIHQPEREGNFDL
ncbi:nucleoside diphosphate kinase regulator [Candidatus Saccharibacteria bacterium]|jgi:regulator of nucleoside diphosphate kinase|nr:nucleoside diphosphate kinase regulator [Candidatus Saccharibacteria bacterium]